MLLGCVRSDTAPCGQSWPGGLRHSLNLPTKIHSFLGPGSEIGLARTATGPRLTSSSNPSMGLISFSNLTEVWEKRVVLEPNGLISGFHYSGLGLDRTTGVIEWLVQFSGFGWTDTHVNHIINLRQCSQRNDANCRLVGTASDVQRKRGVFHRSAQNKLYAWNHVASARHTSILGQSLISRFPLWVLRESRGRWLWVIVMRIPCWGYQRGMGPRHTTYPPTPRKCDIRDSWKSEMKEMREIRDKEQVYRIS